MSAAERIKQIAVPAIVAIAADKAVLFATTKVDAIDPDKHPERQWMPFAALALVGLALVAKKRPTIGVAMIASGAALALRAYEEYGPAVKAQTAAPGTTTQAMGFHQANAGAIVRSLYAPSSAQNQVGRSAPNAGALPAFTGRAGGITRVGMATHHLNNAFSRAG